MQQLTPLYDPDQGVMRVIGFMSGSGSNIEQLIQQQQDYQLVAIFSDNAKSKAMEIGRQYDLPVITRDITAFYKQRNTPRQDLLLREVFDAETVKLLEPLTATAAAYAGYMSTVTRPLLQRYLGINVHPADLTIMEENNRKYVGLHVVRKALLAGETHLRSTTHLVEEGVDQGRLLMRSPKISVQPFNNIHTATEKYQNELKQQGDWLIFPKTLEYIATGRIAQDEQGSLYFDNKPIPGGIEW